MHNRRFGAFLVGAWLTGTILVWFFTSQTLKTANHLTGSPPQHVHKEVTDMGTDRAGNLFRHQAHEVNRRVTETWEVLQVAIAAALFVTSFLTPHRSKTALGAAVVLGALAAVNAFYVTPAMAALGRSFDFLPAGTASEDRLAYASLSVWHRVIYILQVLVALALAARLLFDLYEFRRALRGAGSGRPEHGRQQRHRKDSRAAHPAGSATPGADAMSN